MRKTEPADERFVENRPQIHAIHGEIADFRRSKNDTGHYCHSTVKGIDTDIPKYANEHSLLAAEKFCWQKAVDAKQGFQSDRSFVGIGYYI